MGSAHRASRSQEFVAYPSAVVERYRRRRVWLDRSLWDLFAERFREYGERPALVWNQSTLSYAGLGRRSEELAGWLAAVGVGQLDRVVLQLPNVPELVLSYLALQRLGAIPIMALPAHREREIGHFVELSGARTYLCANGALGATVRELHPTLKRVVSLDELRALDNGAEQPPLPTIDPLGPAVLLLSGGTTGLPKLIPRTHNDYWYNSIASGDVNDIRAGDALLEVLPLGHNFPLASPGLQAFLQRGARVVLSQTTEAEANLALVERHRVTHLELVPALLIRWLEDPSLPRHDLSSIRVVNTGGHRLQPEVKRRCEDLLPGCTVQEVLGMAEGLLCMGRLDDPPEVRLETAGRPVSDLDEVRVVDERDRDVGTGEVGELLARGPYTIRGYYAAPEHNAAAFTSDGYYRTGDLVRLDGAGNLVVAGRRKDLINRGGEKISAEEVENLMLGHPAVLDAACVAVPDPVLGERMCACVVARPGTSLRLPELTQFLLGRGIAKFKLPERLELLDEFPTTQVGKVSKPRLLEIVLARAVAAG